MLLYIIFPIAGVLVGIALGLSSWITYDKARKRRLEYLIKKGDIWCIEHCKKMEACMANHDDQDKAVQDLVNAYCCKCPMGESMERNMRR
jgi:hypothetical protein